MFIVLSVGIVCLIMVGPVYQVYSYPDKQFRCTLYAHCLLFIPRSMEYIREIETTRPALPYDYTCFADGTSFE